MKNTVEPVFDKDSSKYNKLIDDYIEEKVDIAFKKAIKSIIMPYFLNAFQAFKLSLKILKTIKIENTGNKYRRKAIISLIISSIPLSFLAFITLMWVIGSFFE